jgi:hypothetical protein
LIDLLQVEVVYDSRAGDDWTKKQREGISQGRRSPNRGDERRVSKFR